MLIKEMMISRFAVIDEWYPFRLPRFVVVGCVFSFQPRQDHKEQSHMYIPIPEII